MRFVPKAIRPFFNDPNIIALLFIGFVFRLVVFYGFSHFPVTPDSGAFIDLSRSLLHFKLAGYNGQRSPGYPLFLALTYGKFHFIIAYQFVLGLLTAVIWYRILLHLKFKRKIAFFFTLFLQSFLSIFLYEISILVETLTLFLISVVVYYLVKGYTERKSLKFEFLFSAILGYLVLVKPFYAFLPFLIFGFFMLKHFAWRSFFSRKLIIFIFPLIAYFGWSYVNKINTGYFVSTTFFGLNIAQNCVRFAEKGPKKYDWISKPYVKHREMVKNSDNKILAMSIWYTYNAGEFDQYNLSFADLSHKLGEYGKATIENNPGDYLNQVFRYSWFDFWKPSIYWNTDEYHFKNDNSFFRTFLFYQNKLLFLLKLAFLLLAIYYFIRTLFTRKISIPFMLCALVVSTSLLQAAVTYGNNNRFSFPFEFIMLIVVALFLKENGILFKSSKKLSENRTAEVD